MAGNRDQCVENLGNWDWRAGRSKYRFKDRGSSCGHLWRERPRQKKVKGM